MKKLLLYLSCFLMVACSEQTAPIACHWEFSRNDVEPRQAEAYLTITNLSGRPLEADWTLYFCMEAMTPICQETDELCGTQIQGSYHCYRPSAHYRPIPADSSRTYCLRFRGNGIRENKHPEGLFMVTEKNPQPVTIACTYAPYTRREQMFRGIETWEKTPYADGEYAYAYNAEREATEIYDTQLPFFPQPKKVVYGTDTCWIDQAVVTVRDEGPGMDEATLRRVFEKFYQGDTTHASEGNGLGLSLVKRIVDLCQGKVEVDSAPGQGSTFTVRLPLEK